MRQELQALGDAVGTVPRGVPQAVIDALPLARFSAPVAAAAAAAPLPAASGAAGAPRADVCMAALRVLGPAPLV